MLLFRLLILALAIPVVTTLAAEREPDRPHGREILALLGAKMENGGSPDALASYEAIFQRLDANQDGWLNTQEFVEDGKYLTREARQGIFRASDSDASGLVTKDEYLVNRVITDEAKNIFQAMDTNGDGRLIEEEFVTQAKMEDKALAARVFQGFDADGDGGLIIPEYLRVWGQWAREAPVTARLIAKKDTYVLPQEWQGDDFRRRITEEKECDKLPAPPKVNLVLELRNTGNDPVMIWPGGGIDEPELSVTGPGLVSPDNLESFSGSSSATTPQPVILPGEKFRISIKSLNPGGFSLDNVYWTKPGEYTVRATYPVWKNLPPHLPALFKCPEPKGPAIKFLVQTPPVKVKVVADDGASTAPARAADEAMEGQGGRPIKDGAGKGRQQPERPRMYFADTISGRAFSKDPAVVKFKGTYHLYYSLPPYEGKPTPGWSIGIATSDDLVAWQKAGELPNTGEVERNGFCAPGAIVLDGKVHLFYQTYGNGPRDAICHAWSEDGIRFTRNPTNPIFRPAGSWNCGRAIDADVIEHDGRLLLYWATRDPAFKIQMQGVAAAPIGSGFARDKWTQLNPDGPILQPELPWERRCIEAAAMARHDGRLYMFYAGGYNNEPQQIGVAVSDDGVHFQRLSEEPFLTNGSPGAWNSSESGHPFLFQDDDGRDYLFFQGNNDGGRTWYLSMVPIGWQDGRPMLLP